MSASFNTDLRIEYAGFDDAKCQAIASAIVGYETGSGYAFGTDQRNVTVTVPNEKLPAVLKRLRAIGGLTIKQHDGHGAWSEIADLASWQREVIVRNATKDPSYAPYCTRCTGLVRMHVIEPLYWSCACGSRCDYREHFA